MLITVISLTTILKISSALFLRFFFFDGVKQFYLVSIALPAGGYAGPCHIAFKMLGCVATPEIEIVSNCVVDIRLVVSALGQLVEGRLFWYYLYLKSYQLLFVFE